MPKYKTAAKKVNCITIIVTIRSIRINIEVKQLKEQICQYERESKSIGLINIIIDIIVEENKEKYEAECMHAHNFD